MNPVQLGSLPQQSIEQQSQSNFSTQSRREKTENFLTQVLPTALSLGLEASQTARAKGSYRGSATAAATTSSASGLTQIAGTSASSMMAIVGGIMGAANIALSWGRSTPAAGAANGLAVGAAIGTVICPGIGTAIGAAAGTLVGGLLGCIKTGKHRDQRVRDSVRDFLVQQQVLAPDYTISLADGSRYNIGIDGGPKAEFGGRRPYEVDFSNPLAQYAVSWINPLIDLLSQGNEKVKTDFTGYFANAALSNASSLDDVRANVAMILSQFGVTDELLYQGVIQSGQTGRIPVETARAYLSGIDERRDPTFNPRNHGMRPLPESSDTPDIEETAS